MWRDVYTSKKGRLLADRQSVILSFKLHTQYYATCTHVCVHTCTTCATYYMYHITCASNLQPFHSSSWCKLAHAKFTNRSGRSGKKEFNFNKNEFQLPTSHFFLTMILHLRSHWIWHNPLPGLPHMLPTNEYCYIGKKNWTSNEKNVATKWQNAKNKHLFWFQFQAPNAPAKSPTSWYSHGT